MAASDEIGDSLPELQGLRQDWEPAILRFLAGGAEADPGHGPAHLRRVVATAVRLAVLERASLAVVWPAAWLHDCVSPPKDSPDRAGASRLAAARAVDFLAGAGYPGEHLDGIRHAIEAHSWSAGIEPQTVEARVVQDADRIDALGAIGIARCVAVGATLGRPLYADEDPFCDRRVPDDAVATLDHFQTKLLRIATMMRTAAGRDEALRRTLFMRDWLAQLRGEIGG